MWELRVGGRVVGTTGEHPFYAWERGWVACRELKVGDSVLCEDDSWRAVEGVRDTGNWRRVYNLRVADYHTYFVGQVEWGFAVWAHNDYDPRILDFRNKYNISGVKADGSGLSRGFEATIALAYQNDKPNTVVYGVNKYAEASTNSATSVTDTAKLNGFKLPDEVYQQFRNEISDPSRKSVTVGDKTLNLWYDLSKLGEPAFLKHAEFASLYYLWLKNGQKPLGEVTIISDRAICRYDNGCLKNLPLVLDLFGITRLTDMSGRNGNKPVPTAVMVPGQVVKYPSY